MSSSGYNKFILALFLALVSGLNVVQALATDSTDALAAKSAAEWGSTIRKNSYLNRGEATNLVVKHFQLEQKNSKFLRECEDKPDECLFSFSAMTNFHGFKTNPMILYPDVGPAYRYYKAIKIATELDLVRGYYAEEESPYRPLQPISRVEALKLVLGASGLMGWKEKFELAMLDLKPNWMTEGLNENEWWYARYIAGAADKGIIASTENFQPADNISKTEFLDLLESTQKIVASGQKTSDVDNGGQGNL